MGADTVVFEKQYFSQCEVIALLHVQSRARAFPNNKRVFVLDPVPRSRFNEQPVMGRLCVLMAVSSHSHCVDVTLI